MHSSSGECKHYVRPGHVPGGSNVSGEGLHREACGDAEIADLRVELADKAHIQGVSPGEQGDTRG